MVMGAKRHVPGATCQREAVEGKRRRACKQEGSAKNEGALSPILVLSRADRSVGSPLSFGEPAAHTRMAVARIEKRIGGMKRGRDAEAR